MPSSCAHRFEHRADAANNGITEVVWFVDHNPRAIATDFRCQLLGVIEADADLRPVTVLAAPAAVTLVKHGAAASEWDGTSRANAKVGLSARCRLREHLDGLCYIDALWDGEAVLRANEFYVVMNSREPEAAGVVAVEVVADDVPPAVPGNQSPRLKVSLCR